MVKESFKPDIIALRACLIGHIKMFMIQPAALSTPATLKHILGQWHPEQPEHPEHPEHPLQLHPVHPVHPVQPEHDGHGLGKQNCLLRKSRNG